MRTHSGRNIVYPELSYKIIGILFEIHNELGSRYQEKYYQRAIELSLNENHILFEKEKMVPLIFKDITIGKYFLDFVIENKIALEVKTIDFFTKKDWRQVKGYLKSANLELGILANFNSERLVYKRILNSNFLHSDSFVKHSDRFG
ncbi:hypothetical protein A2866_06235 [Candidatus Roizmanbacteria bacterium RIFCSPHIGHO2_01_FULL_39_8]|uniref:GxxExxY protein n=1 Tax=Candidatus Roizmanbacteria bacterium RIFCSPHIGHO2_01_FULL_39_8 TaxID=1802033 RepID=A0A1F7GMG3_9BACT|nr:MAG: hypothetical protein A2866_06235 [Candidatus Roizmanbacteria bacterium RIFCSPHIGHO2_01_FULL_39_8]